MPSTTHKILRVSLSHADYALLQVLAKKQEKSLASCGAEIIQALLHKETTLWEKIQNIGMP